MKLFKKKKKIIDLIDFSIQNVSTGQVQAMIKHLAEKQNNYHFEYIQVNYNRNHNSDLRCYLTMDYRSEKVIQWFADRTSAQVEEFAKKFHINSDGNFTLDK